MKIKSDHQSRAEYDNVLLSLVYAQGKYSFDEAWASFQNIATRLIISLPARLSPDNNIVIVLQNQKTPLRGFFDALKLFALGHIQTPYLHIESPSRLGRS